MVKSTKITKKKIVKLILKRLLPKELLSMVVYFGDDTSNESAWKYLNSKKYLNRTHIKKDDFKVYSCVVGKKPSDAKFFVNSPRHVMDVLEHLNKLSSRIKKNKSSSDLREQEQRDLGSSRKRKTLPTSISTFSFKDEMSQQEQLQKALKEKQFFNSLKGIEPVEEEQEN